MKYVIENVTENVIENVIEKVRELYLMSLEDRSLVTPEALKSILCDLELKNYAVLRLKKAGLPFDKYSAESQVSDLENYRLKGEFDNYYFEVSTRFRPEKNAVLTHIDYMKSLADGAWIDCAELSGYTEKPTMESVMEKINKDMGYTFNKIVLVEDE